MRAKTKTAPNSAPPVARSVPEKAAEESSEEPEDDFSEAEERSGAGSASKSKTRKRPAPGRAKSYQGGYVPRVAGQSAEWEADFTPNWEIKPKLTVQDMQLIPHERVTAMSVNLLRGQALVIIPQKPGAAETGSDHVAVVCDDLPDLSSSSDDEQPPP